MTERKPRQPTAVTLRCRAFSRAERLREKIDAAAAVEITRREKHDKRMATMIEQLGDADSEISKSVSIRPSSHRTPGEG